MSAEEIEATARDSLAQRRVLRRCYPPGGAVRPVPDGAEDIGDTENDEPDDLPVVVGYAQDKGSSRLRLILRAPEGGLYLRDPQGWEPVEPEDA